MRRGWLVVLVALACTSPQRPPPAPVANRPSPSGPRSPVCPPLPADARPTEGIRLDAPETAALACEDGRRSCRVELAVTVVNCRAEPVTIGGDPMYFDMDHPAVDSEIYEQPHTVAPGEAWTFTASTRGAGEVTVRARVTTSGWVSEIASAAIHVTNPARDAALAACRACNGDWGHHGMMVSIDPSPGVDQGEDCNCRTRDKDKVCQDGDDCEGWCEFERFVVTGHTGTPPQEIGYSVGRCSEFVTPWSCTSPIPSGARARPPAPLEIISACVD